jgi:23S rRNA pseudouridine1911/1915/1917 synthase
MKTKIDVTVRNLYATQRIDAYLTEALAGKFSRQEVKSSIKDALIFLNEKAARPRDPVKEGDRIHGVLVTEEKWPLEPENIPVKVLYEDESLLVVDKPAGLVVHPGAGNKKGTLVHALLGRKATLSSLGDAHRPGIVHRLDKDTSGLLIVAKDNFSHRALQSQFAARSLSKTYVALVKGSLEYEEGRLEQPLARDPKNRHKMAVSREDFAHAAQTHYRVLERFRYTTLLEIKLITGRTHQIRVHMQHLGHPVVGDPLYGNVVSVTLPKGRLALHASKIEFLHPKTGKLMKVVSPIPPEKNVMIDQAKKE